MKNKKVREKKQPPNVKFIGLKRMLCVEAISWHPAVVLHDLRPPLRISICDSESLTEKERDLE